MKLSPLKRIIFTLVAVTGTFVLVLLVLFVADLYAHTRVERSAGLNRQGYRGSVAGRKRPGEIRIVMLGGSTVFGFNVEVDEAIPPQLEKNIATLEPDVRVINLGYHQEAAISFVPTLRSYEYLDYDIVLLYEGYNDILGDAAPNTAQKRHASPLFRAIGYYPILPQILREKASFLRHGKGSQQVEFRPGLANRTSAAALDVSSAFAEALGRRLDSLVDPVEAAPHTGPGCSAPWSHYCGSVAAAVRFARERGKLVLVIGQPRLPYREAERHASQQRALSAMLARDFGSDPGVHYVDIFDAVDLASNSMDGLHLTGPANGIVAQRLVGPVREMIVRHRQGTPAR